MKTHGPKPTNKLPCVERGRCGLTEWHIAGKSFQFSWFWTVNDSCSFGRQKTQNKFDSCWRACFCPCFSRIHSSYRDYTKPLFIAQHKLKLIFVFQDVSGRANDAAEKSTFYWSFPKEERNGVQVYEYRYVTWISFDIGMGHVSKSKPEKSMKKTHRSQRIHMLKKRLILKPPGLVLFIFMRQFSPMKFETPTHHLALPVEARCKIKGDVFFLKSKGQGFFSS